MREALARGTTLEVLPRRSGSGDLDEWPQAVLAALNTSKLPFCRLADGLWLDEAQRPGVAW